MSRGTAGADGPGGATLVVVESPAKARTVLRCLGPGHVVRATMGHLVDLPEGRLGVEVERGFEPTYEVLKGKNKLLSELKREARSAARVLLATDPDREGEAIAWHLAEALGAPGGSERIRRILLHELTPEAIRAAMSEPRDLDRRRFEAQQARRILDRLVGFQVSPVLWRRVKRGLSAGRVQSVAVRLVVERERTIQAFRPEVAWSVEAVLGAAWKTPFTARLTSPAGGAWTWHTRTEADVASRLLEDAVFTVVETAPVSRDLPPPAPFTTATLQQVAAGRLGLSPRRTMALAQRLYEGVELGDEGSVGLLSYMRTDSTRLSPSIVEAARRHIAQAFGVAHLPVGPRTYPGGPGTRAAHEAIRPASLEWTPERVKAHLNTTRERDLLRLYQLVWNRFLASQMASAVRDDTAVVLAAESPGRPVATFRADGSALRVAGWLAADPDGEAERAPAAPSRLPPLLPGQHLRLEALASQRNVTLPPLRFTEATLVEALDARGLGRPSTFAAIVDTVQARGYVERRERRLQPTSLGWRVTDALLECLPTHLDVDFTAGLEADLDRIEEGKADWRAVVERFHGPLRQALALAEADSGAAVGSAVLCEKCGRTMVLRWGKRGEFLACPSYPACRHTLEVRRQGGVVAPLPSQGGGVVQPCPRCGGPMVERRGRTGRFVACARHPACQGTRAPSLDVPCPLGCGGEVEARRSKRGRPFFGCSAFPACHFVSWDRPRGEPCPDCGGTWLVEAMSRRLGPVLACPERACGYRRPAVGVWSGDLPSA
jgi:DNA topoisomerase-1